MVEGRDLELDRVFRALASAPRREILRLAARKSCTVTELAAHFDMTLAAVSKHIGVLDDAGLLVGTRAGRRHWRRFNPSGLALAATTIEQLRLFWNKQLDGLQEFLAEDAVAATAKRKRGTRR